MMQIEYFATYLTDRLEPEGTDLPICNSAVADLLALMPDEDDYIYLALKGIRTMKLCGRTTLAVLSSLSGHRKGRLPYCITTAHAFLQSLLWLRL